MIASTLVIYAYYKSLPPENLYRAKEKDILTRKIEHPAPIDERVMWRAHSQKELARLKDENKVLIGELEKLKTTVDALAKESVGAEHSMTNTSPLPVTRLPPPPTHKKTTNGNFLLPPPGLDTDTKKIDLYGRKNLADSGNRSNNRSSNKSNTGPSTGQVGDPSVGDTDFFVIDMATSVDNAGEEGEKSEIKTVDNYLPPGTYIKTRMLSGLDAPTGGQAQKDPVPFLLRLTDNGQLPNGFRSHVKHCFVTLAGFGNMSDSRVYGRTEKISCVLKDKTVFDANIKAWVSGEDGKAGLQGKIQNRRGQLIAYSLLSGLGGGLGEAIAQSFTTLSTNPVGSTTSVNPDEIGKFGIAQGFGTALDRISRWYLDRADEIYPVVEINAGRTPEIVLLEGLTFHPRPIRKTSNKPLVTQATANSLSILEVP